MRWRTLLSTRPATPSVVLALALASVAACGACSSHEAPPRDAAAAATCRNAPLAASGMGTYYDATGAGNCSFDPSPGDLLVAALNAPDYAHAAWCGACLAVTGPLGEVVVRIVDQCPGCKHGDLDLSREAFARIAALSAGRVAITWHEVACPVTGPIRYQLKAGSNADWVAFQIRNHRYAIEGLEARGASGGYQAIARADYNYFVADKGLGAGPFSVRVTDVHGHVLDDAAIALGSDVTRAGSAQLATCP
jgi:expansin (peptidoglycan-binding protein)